MKNLIFIADAHIDDDSEEVHAFARFLKSIQPSTKMLCLLGDLFNLWFATKRLEHGYHGEILDHLRELRLVGIKLIYVEGNRDFHIKRAYYDDPFNEISDEEWVEVFEGKRFYMHHGDKVNVDDHAYRIWRRLSKSKLTWKLFDILPFGAKTSVAGKLEKMLSKTNIKHKSYFPQKRCEEYGERILRAEYHAAVIGHLHQEKILRFDINGQQKSLYSLPAWKLEKRYLLFEPGKEGRFVSFTE
jgi:UDP-2,3-diacylglucosamine hydrolase